MDPPTHHHHHHQEMESQQTLESILECTKAASSHQEKKPKPAEDALKCPRCDSTNTKFCYYNNYSLTQPRYFCKSCRRYWTKGGTLRNVPVGGGCRKNKRSSSSSSKRSQDQAISSPNPNNNNPLSSFTYDSSDISLAIARLQSQNVGQMGFGGGEHGFSILGNNNNHLDHYGGVLGNHGLIGGLFENPSNGSTYNGGGNMGYLENGGLSLGFNGNDEMGNSMPYFGQEMGGFGNTTTTTTTGGAGAAATATITTVKQEMCNLREGESRVHMGFPWQFGGEAGKLVDFEPVKQNWNGFGPSSWHGLLNSPLM